MLARVAIFCRRGPDLPIPATSPRRVSSSSRTRNRQGGADGALGRSGWYQFWLMFIRECGAWMRAGL